MGGIYQPEYLRKIKALLSWTLPQVYTDNITNVELLNRVVWFLNNKNTPVLNNVQEALNLTSKEVDELTKLLNDIKDGKYADLYIEQLSKWIDDNLINYVARMAFYVFPTLKYDENKKVWRYCIYVPQSWKQLKFRWTWDTDRHVWYLSINY